MRNKINASAILLLSFLSTSTLALGQNGHRIVADIAEEHLTPEAKAALMEITNGDPLAKLATWPDEIRSDKHWDFAKPWHYVSVDDDESFDGFTRSKEGDILKALSDYELQLRDKTLTREEKWQALAFLFILLVIYINRCMWVAGMTVAAMTLPLSGLEKIPDFMLYGIHH